MGGRVTARPVVDLAVGEYLSALAAATPVPGGGSAAALAGAMGSGLLTMVARIAYRKAKDSAAQESLRWLEIEFERCMEDLQVLSQEDIDAYEAVVVARRVGSPTRWLRPPAFRSIRRTRPTGPCGSRSGSARWPFVSPPPTWRPPDTFSRPPSRGRWPMRPSTYPTSRAIARWSSSSSTKT
jgi:hypothetical protein